MEERGGAIELLLPLATLEPVRELLLQRFLGEKFGRDTIWESHLATELWSTEIEIDAILDKKVMELGDVMDLLNHAYIIGICFVIAIYQCNLFFKVLQVLKQFIHYFFLDKLKLFYFLNR